MSFLDKESISLNKYISSTGICSRRVADTWIEAGRVTINDNIARKGNRVFDGDRVHIDGKPLKSKPRPVYIKYNKPPGVTCTTDRSDKSNIIDRINYKERIFPIGRLDKNSTGLILLTNDGDIVNKVLRKENKHEKEYIVKVDRSITKQFIQRMSKPIPMLGKKTLPCKVIQVKEDTFRIILTQGLNRQIRRMCQFCDYRVLSLKRVRIMKIKLDGLKSGEWKYLSDKEEQELHNKTSS